MEPPFPLCCVHEGVSALVYTGRKEAAQLRVQLEGTEDDKAVEVPTALAFSSVRGVALHGGVVAVWSVERLEAYALVGDGREGPAPAITALQPLGALAFPSPPAAMAVVGSHDRAIAAPPSPPPLRRPARRVEGKEEEKEEVKGDDVVVGASAAVAATIFVAVDTRVEIHRLPFSPSHPAAASSSSSSSEDKTPPLTPPKPLALLAFSEREGRPTLLDASGGGRTSGRLLAAATDAGCIKLFDLDRHPPRALGSAGRLRLPSHDDNTDPESPTPTPTPGPPLLVPRSLRINADGSWVSLLATAAVPPEQEEEKGTSNTIPGPLGLYLYDVDRDVVVLPAKGVATKGGTVVGHVWDARDPRLLAVELRGAGSDGGSEVALLFLPDPDDDGDDEDGPARHDAASPGGSPILQLERFPLSPASTALVGLRVPRLYLATTVKDDGALPPVRLLRRTMRAFLGLDYGAMDAAAQAALRAFHGHLLRGDLAAVHRMGAKIRNNPLVWENMARLCVRARRLDAAALCLGRMGHARGARAVRLARGAQDDEEEEELVALAMAATQLGMLDEAARLYTEARRPDLLLRLLVARGHWEEALALAEADGDLSLRRRRTHFEYARHLEALGRVEAAAGHYALAGAEHRETPRMLLLQQQQQQHDVTAGDNPAATLARFIARATATTTTTTTTDPSPSRRRPRLLLLRWSGAHCEAQRRFAEAKAAYRSAGAWAELVRLACYEGDLAAAEAVIAEQQQEKGRKQKQNQKRLAAACFTLARHLEGQEHDVLRAIEFYAQAGCYAHCVRLARAHDLDGEAAAYALKGPPSLMRDTARHFASRGRRQGQHVDTSRALQLYAKAGEWALALRLCLRAIARAEAEEAAAAASATKKPPAVGAGRRQQQQQQQSELPSLVEAAREIARGLLEAGAAEAAGASGAARSSSAVDSGGGGDVARLAGVLERHGRPHEAIQLHLLRLSAMMGNHDERGEGSREGEEGEDAIAVARRVLRLCARHGDEAPLTDGMVDRILLVATTTVSASSSGASGAGGKRRSGGGSSSGDGEEKEGEQAERRLRALLAEAAAVSARQGSHAQASRLYAQAGDTRAALECLCALGDADAVVRYARGCRRPELFLLAAERLRESGAWRRDEGVRAAVGEFLVRGKAGDGAVRAFEEESGRSRMLVKDV